MSRNDDNIAPNTRLFILGGKGLSKEDWEGEFQEFGTIKDIWVVQDKRTNEDKGVTYITFSKVSEALLAQEKLNGKRIADVPKPLKVLIATDKREGNTRDHDEEDKFHRIFIKCGRIKTEKQIEEEFSQFGEIEDVNVLRNRDTKESKGLAYVRFYRPYHAALAIENCETTYRAMFASKKPEKTQVPLTGYEIRGNASGGAGSGMGGPAFGKAPRDMLAGYANGSTETRLEIMVPATLTQDHLYKLLDLIPGLEFCELDRRTSIAFVRYATPACAAYAKDKLSGFEYPLGSRLGVRFPQVQGGANYHGDQFSYMDTSSGGGASQYTGGMGTGQVTPLISGAAADVDPNVTSNLSALVESIQQATSMLQAAGFPAAAVTGMGGAGGSKFPTGSSGDGGLIRVTYCNVPLPETKPLESRDAPCAERLFIVSQPESFPDHVLKDAMCRFGCLIDAFFMTGKNYGYAKFSAKENAEKCLDALHGQTIAGNRVKVILADPPKWNPELQGGRRDQDSKDDGGHQSKKFRV